MSQMKRIRFEAGDLKDWTSFFDASAQKFGFQAKAGRNKDAWLECMEDLDTRSEPLVRSGEFVLIDFAGRFIDRNVDRDVEVFLVSGAAHVNGARTANGERPYLICAERNAR